MSNRRWRPAFIRSIAPTDGGWLVTVDLDHAGQKRREIRVTHQMAEWVCGSLPKFRAPAGIWPQRLEGELVQ